MVVVSEPTDFPQLSGTIRASDWLTQADDQNTAPGTPVLNLARGWRPRTEGWMVSLIGEARGLRVLPTVDTLAAFDDLQARWRAISEAGVPVDPEPRGEIPPEEGLRVASIVLGRVRDPAVRTACSRIFTAWPMPLLRAAFRRVDERWTLLALSAPETDAWTDLERAHLASLLRLQLPAPPHRSSRRWPSVAVLWDPSDPFKPSSEETIATLERVAYRRGLRVERIGLDDLDHLGEHDALFIRTCTGPELPSWRFATRAEALGIPVLDHPEAIVRCCDKAWLHQRLSRAGVPLPPTALFGKGQTWSDLTRRLGSPLVVKIPDGSFGVGVFKMETEAAFDREVPRLLSHSPLLVAQGWLRTAFDWRVGVLDGKVLFVARYHMARGHWQIRKTIRGGQRYGRVEAIAKSEAPRAVLQIALQAAACVGLGFFGVDIKEGPTGPVVIEVNDNPNLDLGVEDEAEGERVYLGLADAFLRRLGRGSRGRLTGPGMPGTDGPAMASVMGLELEYALVASAETSGEPLGILHAAEPTLAALAGRPASDAVVGRAGLSNELVDHLLEIKNPKPLLHAAEIEQGLVDGVRAAARFLQERAGGRLLPGGMHPTLDPQEARPWRRSDQRLIRTYERHFGLQNHARANVQALQINLPMGSDQDAVFLMNAAALLVPYLPALAASSPLIERNLGTSVDNRLACLLAQSEPIPSRRGDFVPEYLDRYADYRNHILGPMFEAVDTLPEAEPIRQDFLNGRAAVFRLSRRAIEIRLCDTQECPKMDVAIAVFVRKAIRWLAQRLREGQFVRPDHTVLVRDLHAVICDGTQARVLAPHLLGERGRAVDGTISAAEALRPLLARVRARPSAESAYLDLIARILDSGNLSEAIRRQLRPLEADRSAFEARLYTIYNELADCLVANQPWEGRFT